VKQNKNKLVAVLACRNQSNRLYAKPLQFLDKNNKIRVIDQIILALKKIDIFDNIILAIAKKKENLIYEDIAKKHKIKFIYGPENNVIKRLILSANKHSANEIFRVTSESPFIYHNLVKKMLTKYRKSKLDAIFLDNIIDGSGFEIFSLNSMKESLKFAKGDAKEHVTKYIRLNKKKFKMIKFSGPKEFFRKDLRLTIDNPEDLIVCKAIYDKFKKDAPLFSLKKIINFLDKNPKYKKLVSKYTVSGYKTMYI
jgi:spore coat polysaccharide biosynthesis protein SpsF